ncbi:MAG: hypothetical protein ABIG42_11465 [bacterium]
MIKIKCLVMVIVSLCVLVSCGKEVKKDGNQPQDAISSEPRESANAFDPPVGASLTHMNNMSYFMSALISFYRDNDRFPQDMREFLEWDGILLWPINPLTYKPVKCRQVIDQSKFGEYGDFVYVFNSDDDAHFESMFYNQNTKEWRMEHWPTAGFIPQKVEEAAVVHELLERRTNATRFISGISRIADGVFFHTKNRQMAFTLKEQTSLSYKVILDNWNPITTSKNVKTPGYFELGIDREKRYLYTIKTRAENDIRKIAYYCPDNARKSLIAYADQALEGDEVDNLDKEILFGSWMTADEIKQNGGGITIDEILTND